MNLCNFFRRISPSRWGIFVFVAALFIPISCRKSNTNGNFPEDFQSRPDEKKVEFLMESESPDSVARFIYSASLGKIDGVSLDLNAASLYALENYKGEDLEKFAAEYDLFRDKLPLIDKMKFYQKEGMLDSLSVGLQLGLGYVASIRENKKSVKESKEEILKFKEACKNDSTTYRNFVIGLRYALKHDHGKDLDEKIYNEFINFEPSIQ